MPSLARVLELVTSVLEGLVGVTVETHSEQGHQHILVRVAPNSSPADEASPATGTGTESLGFSVISTSGSASGFTAAANWWESTTPVHPGPQVLALSSQLREGGELSGIERIKIAYGRGRQAARIYRGECSCFSGPRCSLRNRCYVVLRARHHPVPFFTWNLGTHQTAVRPPPGDFDHRAISNGFASQAEARAFCLGAGLRDLAETLP